MIEFKLAIVESIFATGAICNRCGKKTKFSDYEMAKYQPEKLVITLRKVDLDQQLNECSDVSHYCSRACLDEALKNTKGMFKVDVPYLSLGRRWGDK